MPPATSTRSSQDRKPPSVRSTTESTTSPGWIGDDIKISPGKAIVPIYRKHVIAQIKPSTRTRIDFGLALKDTPAKRRLIDTGGLAKKDRITHRIEITSLDDVDTFVEKWLRKAYELDA